MIEHLTIERIAHRGDGQAQVVGQTIYVPYTLPGEVVEAETVPGHPDRRHLLRITQPSADRIAAFCPHFGTCGGCAIQHWREDKYRAWKFATLIETLQAARIETQVDDMIDAHGEGRRRIVLHARRGTHDVLQVGFAAINARHIIAIDHCPITAPGLNGAIPAAWALAEALQAIDKPLDIHITATLDGMDVDLRGSGPIAPRDMTKLAAIASEHKIARLTRHGELIVQHAPPSIMMGAARVVLPPGSFLQATGKGEETLGALVVEHCRGAKNVVDLFCGVGPFALRLAQKARMQAFDSEAPAIEALRKAAANTKGLRNVQAQARDLFRRPLYPMELSECDALVFDPPRQGAEAQAKQLAQTKVPRIVAVSCNPSTFVRDARLLLDGGYKLARLTPVDQFRHTPHLELVALFTR